VYSNGYIMITNVLLRMYINDHIMYIQGLLLALNGLDIMVTLSVYVEYIKVLYKIFTKYMGTI